MIDDGFILPSQCIQTDLMFDEMLNDFQFRTIASQPVYQFQFFASKNQIISTRRYQKLPELTKANEQQEEPKPQTTLPKNEKKIESQQIPPKLLYEDSVSSEIPETKEPVTKNLSERNKRSGQRDSFWSVFSSIKSNKSLAPKSKPKQDHHLKLSLFQYFCYSLRKLCRRKMENAHGLILQAERRFLEDMDSVKIVARLQELEKLKLLLLDDDQLALFDRLPKPAIAPLSHHLNLFRWFYGILERILL